MITDKELMELIEKASDKRIKDALAELLGRRQFDKSIKDLRDVFRRIKL